MKILISGASGFLGNYCIKTLSAHEIIAQYFTKPPANMKSETVQCDLKNEQAARRLIQSVRPELIINCAACARPDICEKNPELSKIMNAKLPEILAEEALRAGSRLIHISTDNVFSGQNAPYNEESKPAPVNIYGRDKLAGEKNVLAYSAHLVIRMPLLFGCLDPAGTNFFLAIISNLKSKAALDCFTDEYRTPLSGMEAARAIKILLNASPGLYHCPGPERISRYDFALLTGKAVNMNTDNIKPVKQSEKKAVSPRPPDLSMHSLKISKAGFSPLPLYDQITRESSCPEG
ncbi:MAG: hypothetical protein A2096_03750, partial [Spirochaetes bacterium GWF1_41_5]